MLSGMIRAFLVDMSPDQAVCVEEQTGGLGTSLLFSQRGAAERSLHMGVCVWLPRQQRRGISQTPMQKVFTAWNHSENKITESEARRLVKIWLVFGRHVLPSDTERSDHVRFNPRSFGEDLLESVLDALVSGM